MTKTVFTGLLLVSLLVAAYGCVAFFLMNDLPPNGGPQGRLPSLYVMLGGIGGMLVGTVGRNLKIK
ncbi:MAG: hypothetical protein AAGE65_05505 [Planctomycetota bacterium]